jgi:hypothetical protein
MIKRNTPISCVMKKNHLLEKFILFAMQVTHHQSPLFVVFVEIENDKIS